VSGWTGLRRGGRDRSAGGERRGRWLALGPVPECPPAWLKRLILGARPSEWQGWRSPTVHVIDALATSQCRLGATSTRSHGAQWSHSDCRPNPTRSPITGVVPPGPARLNVPPPAGPFTATTATPSAIFVGARIPRSRSRSCSRPWPWSPPGLSTCASAPGPRARRVGAPEPLAPEPFWSGPVARRSSVRAPAATRLVVPPTVPAIERR